MNRATPALLAMARSGSFPKGMAPLLASTDNLSQTYDTFLFDADGVLWTGDRPVPGAIEFIGHLLRENKRVFILTNNSTKTHDMYMAKLEKIGFGTIPPENVISAAMVIADFVKNSSDYQGQEVFLLGTKNLQKTLEAVGVKCVGVGPDHMTDYGEQDILQKVDLEHTPRAVICSYDCHFSYPKLMKAANYLARPEVDFLVTNEDYTFPGHIPGFVIPGAGFVGAAMRAVTGRTPTVFGKPGRQMAEFLKKNHHIDPSRTIMFGDRLDTDIHFANSNGFASCLVLTGVSSLEDAGKAELEDYLKFQFPVGCCICPISLSRICTTGAQLKDSGEAQKSQGWISKLLTGQQMDPSGWQKQSHSSLLSNSERIYEISTHNYHPGSKSEYLNSFDKYKGELSEKLPTVELVGSWTVAYGRNRDQAVHLWRYTNGYKDVDNSISLHSSDNSLVAAETDVARLCGRRKNVLVKPFSYWREPQKREGQHVYDFRSYVLQPGSMIEWANAWARGITFRREHNQDVGGFFAQVGQLYIVYHIWAYPSMSARHDTRTSTWAKPGWDATVAYTVPLVKKMQSKILTPTKYSQLQ